jgi:hypothetical protein
VIEGLDGLWDGHLKAPEDVRVTFRIRTDEHGTLAWLESSRSEGTWFAATISRDGDEVSIDLQTRSVHGRLSADGQRVEGRWRRDEKSLPLILTRRTPGAPAPRVSNPEAIDLPPEALADFVGVYAPEAGPRMTLGIHDGRLWVLAPTGKPPSNSSRPDPTPSTRARPTRRCCSSATRTAGVATLVLQMRGRENRHQRVL